jgi:hypothetical protein
MTVINTNYSTIEEAWGAFDEKSRKKKKVRIMTADPLCELYGKRMAKARKPYAEDGEILPSNAGPDASLFGPSGPGSYNKNAFSRTTAAQKESFQASRRVPEYPSISIDKSGVYTAADDDEDDEYFERALLHNGMGSSSSELPHEQDDWEDDRPVPTVKKQCAPITEDEIKRKQQERMFNFGLYIASGVMLIVAMEQLLQLGMKMR